MAVLKFGAIVTSGSGSLGGHTIQHSKGGMQIRTKPIPHGNPSASQILIRSINQQLQAGWHQLTTSQQKIWNDWPVIHGIMNAKGDHRPLSGHSLWMKYNFYYLQDSLPLILYPASFKDPRFGPELVTNGNFSYDGAWTKVQFTILSGICRYSNTNNGNLSQSCSITAGLQYRTGITISNINSGYCKFWPFYNLFPHYPYLSSWLAGSYSYDDFALNSQSEIWFHAYGGPANPTGGNFDLDNISIKQIL